MGTCQECGKELTGRQTKFCSRACKETTALKSSWVLHPQDRSGPSNPAWRGGHRHWSPGRYGKDKDGLSWKTQRKLAWERDNYECQHCHEKKRRNPDVHHINPWMNSMSHALDNLICLCQSCHLKEEAKVQEVWGGQVTANALCPKKNLCVCGEPSILRRQRLCLACVAKLIMAGQEFKLELGPSRIAAIKTELRKHGIEIILPRKPRRATKLPQSVQRLLKNNILNRKVCARCNCAARLTLDRGCRCCLTPWVIEQRKSRTIRDIASELGVSNPTIIHWCHEFHAGIAQLVRAVAL